MKKASKGEIAVCFPGEEKWELWESDSRGRLTHSKSDREDSPGKFKGVSHMAFPVTWVNCAPFWGATDNAGMLSDIVDMRLETTGQRIDTLAGKHHDFEVIERDEGRTLVLAMALAETRGKLDLPKGDAEVFDVSPNLLAMPRNHLVLYRELGRWIACMTRNGKPVYFQALSVDELDASAILELKCLLLQLHSQGVIKELSGIVAWQHLDERTRRLLQDELEMSVLVEERPKPLLPEEPLAIVPRQVAQNRQAADRRQKVRNWLSAAALIYLGIAGWLFAQDFLRQKRIANLRTEITSMRSEYGWIEPASRRWSTNQDAINIARFPIELLHRAVEDLPERGVRLTEFDFTTTRIFMRGEGSDTALVRNYTNQLKGRKDLQDYEWTVPQPKVDPKTNLASFEATAKYRYGSSETE